MSKKDYELIAEAMRESEPKDELQRWHWADVCIILADKLKADNPRFNREQFLSECGLIGGDLDIRPVSIS